MFKKGFTVIETLIIVFIILILIFLIYPNIKMGKETRRHRNTVKSMQEIFSEFAHCYFERDHHVPINKGKISPGVRDMLNDAGVSLTDEWGNEFLIYSGHQKGFKVRGFYFEGKNDLLIISFGRDGKEDNWQYSGLLGMDNYIAEKIKDFNKDLFFWEGIPVRRSF